MSNEAVVQQETRPEVLTKMEAWAKMGRVIHDQNLALQVRAQQSKAKLILKPGLKLIKEAEDALAEVKKELATQTEDRIKITSKFDAVKTSLSLPEKDLSDAIAVAAADLLAVKKEQADIDAAAKNKTDEAKRIREALLNRIAEVDAGYKSMIAIRVADCYERALNGEAPTEDTRAFITQERAWATEEMFTMKQPQIKPTYNTTDEVNAIWDEVKTGVNPASFYLDLFRSELDTKFEFYTIALKHKESSIAASKAKQAETLAQITKDKELAAAGARLEAVATTYAVETVPTAKGLKKKWEIQMEDTDQTALAIISAFVGNFAICRGGVRVKSMQQLSVEQMGGALCLAKNKDEKFTVSGINFVSVDKL